MVIMVVARLVILCKSGQLVLGLGMVIKLVARLVILQALQGAVSRGLQHWLFGIWGCMVGLVIMSWVVVIMTILICCCLLGVVIRSMVVVMILLSSDQASRLLC